MRRMVEDENSLSMYVMKKLRWARVMGILADDNVNWYGTMV